MNSKIKLALAAASAAGAAASLIGQVPLALAGGLSSTQTNNFGAAANYNLTFGGGFSATGNTTQTISPFANTTGSRTAVAGPAPTSTTVIQSGFTEGNAGTSTLTASFDQNGFGTTGSTSSSLATPSFAVQAGIENLGGLAATGNVTTASGTQGIFTTPSVISLNTTGANSATTITLTGAGLNNGVLAASVTGTDLGASSVQGNLIQGLSVVTTLSAF